MKKVIRIAGGAVVALVGVQVIGAKLVQGQVEKTLTELTTVYSQSSGLPLKVLSHKANWFSSDVRIGIPIPSIITEDLKKNFGVTFTKIDTVDYFTLEESFTHGPIIFKDGIHFAAAYASGDMRLSAPSQKTIIQAILKNEPKTDDGIERLEEAVSKLADAIAAAYAINISFGGDFDFKAEGDGGSFTIDKPDENLNLAMEIPRSSTEVSFSPSQGRFVANSLYDGAMTFDFRTPDESGTIKWSKPVIDITSNKLADSLWLGKGLINFGDLTVKVKSKRDDVGFQATQLAYTIDYSPIHDDMIDAQFNISLQDFKMNNGPMSLSFGPFAWNNSIENISVSAMQTLQKMNSEQTNALFGQGQTDLQALDQQNQEMLMKILPDLIAKKPRYKISEFSVAKDGFKSIADFDLHLGDRFDLNAPDDMVKHLLGKGTIQLNEDMVVALSKDAASFNPGITPEQISQMMLQQLSAAVAQGVLKKDGKLYLSDIEIKEGMIFVNGMPVKSL